MLNKSTNRYTSKDWDENSTINFKVDIYNEEQC